MPKKIAYPFDWDHKNDTDLTSLLGGKGANLHRMTVEMGLPVPEGFTIITDQSLSHVGKTVPSAALDSNLKAQVAELEGKTGRVFGDTANVPLLVSVRSGAPVSMPGMMETILNLGLNDSTVESLAAATDERFAWESYMRFVKMFGVIVHDKPARWYDDRIEAAKRFAATDELDPDTLRVLVKNFLTAGPDVPSDPSEQLSQAVMAVFRSWDSDKAKSYREIEGIPDDLGTAVNVQRMVFGNMNDRSATGVAFTRDPNTGENVYFGDFLVNAQGEDVVDGSHVTEPLAAMADWDTDLSDQLYDIMARLERKFHDMCDVEFTVEDGKLFMLQTRVGKRNPAAAVRMAFDMYDEGLIDKATAIERVQSVKQPSGGSADTSFTGTVVGTGTAASPGIAVGKMVLSADEAVTQHENGETVVLVTTETSPDDVKGMAVAEGILTAKGGLVSHAAVVARGWGKPCVVGFDAMNITGPVVTIDGKAYKEGDLVKIDGTTGEVAFA